MIECDDTLSRRVGYRESAALLPHLYVGNVERRQSDSVYGTVVLIFVHALSRLNFDSIRDGQPGTVREEERFVCGCVLDYDRESISVGR